MSWTLNDLSNLREGWDFEAKKAAGRDGRGEVPQALWPTYSAMANTQGGKIVLGLKERANGTFEVHGLAEPDRVERELWDLLSNPQKANLNVLARRDVHQETVGGKVILVIEVPRARRQERPIYVNGDLWRGTYLRIHEGDRHADRERIRRMIADADFDSRDERLVEGFKIDDLDAETVRGYRTMFIARHPDHPWLPLDDETFLSRLGAIGLDRERGKRGLTAAGLLMFSRFETIRDAFPKYFLDYQERAADAETLEWTDRIIPDGTWTGNVFEFYRRVILKLTADLKVPFELDADMVRRDETHVHEAVREALINTLIHADYEGRSSVLVIKTPAGFEFRNPGGLRLPLEEVRVGGLSDCRNRTLQRLFLMIGLGELAGSGYSRIARAWREQGWKSPSLRENVSVDTTTLDLPIDGSSVSSEQSPVSSEQSGANSSVSSEQSAGRSDHKAGRSDHKAGRSDQSTDQSGASTDQSTDQSAGSSSQSTDQSAESSSQSSFDPIARVVGRRWASESEIRDAILYMCRAEFRTAREIAEGLDRAYGTVVRNYIPQLVQNGLLELKNPAFPRHPDQAYRTARRGPPE